MLRDGFDYLATDAGGDGRLGSISVPGYMQAKNAHIYRKMRENSDTTASMGNIYFMYPI
jgi:hypothetical protein